MKTHVCRCWRGAAHKYTYLFRDPDIKRWYDNVSRGSKITADVYLRRLGSICSSAGIENPKELLGQAAANDGRMWAYNFIMDMPCGGGIPVRSSFEDEREIVGPGSIIVTMQEVNER
jgi:hypothetical protein